MTGTLVGTATTDTSGIQLTRSCGGIQRSVYIHPSLFSPHSHHELWIKMEWIVGSCQQIHRFILTCWLKLTVILKLKISVEECGEATGRWWEWTLTGALTREGADANEDICGCLTSLHHLMP